MATAMETDPPGGGTRPFQPQEEPSEKITPPVLIENHVCITHVKGEENYAKQLQLALEENSFKVKNIGGDGVLAVADMKTSQKVIMMVSPEYLSSPKYNQEIQCVEQLTSVRHQEVLIPVLCGGLTIDKLPPRLREGSAVPNRSVSKEYPIAGNEQFWKGVVDGITESRPILSTVTNGVGYGLAWGHFFGYLQFILTNLSSRIQAADKSDWDIQENATLCDKMITIFPKAGRLARSLSDYDPEITSVTFKSDGKPVKVKHTIDFPGHPKKDFSCGIFKATVNNTQYVFFAEVPATLNTLAKMRDSNYVKFTEDEFQVEVERVKTSLENILRTTRDEFVESRLQSIAFVPFDDRELSEEANRGLLSQQIATVINNRQFLENPDV